MTLTEVLWKAPPAVQLDISYCTEGISKRNNFKLKTD